MWVLLLYWTPKYMYFVQARGVHIYAIYVHAYVPWQESLREIHVSGKVQKCRNGCRATAMHA